MEAQGVYIIFQEWKPWQRCPERAVSTEADGETDSAERPAFSRNGTCFSKSSFIERYNSRPIQFTHLKYTIPWFFGITIILEHFHHLKKKSYTL